MVKVVENGERICTVTLDGSESSIVFQNDYKYFAVKNESDADVYVSLNRDIVEGADGVMTIGSKESALFAHMKPNVNMFFVKGKGKIQVFASSNAVNPFKSAPIFDGGVMASGNPVQIDGLQEGVPFSELVVSGKNLIGIAQAKMIIGDSTSGYSVINNATSRTIIQKLQPNTTYHIKKYDSGNRFRIVIFDNEPTNAVDITAKQLIFNADGSISDYTLSTGEDYLWMALATHYATSGEAIEPIVQLEYGSTPTEYEPPTTGRELTVNVCGKNLIPTDYMSHSGTYNGVTFNVNDNGKFDISGTATKGFALVSFIKNMSLVGGKKYTFSCNKQYDINTFNCAAKILSKDGIWKHSVTSYPSTIIASDGDYIGSLGIWANEGVEISAENVELQLEIGDTATEYETPVGSKITITPTSNPYVIPNDIRQVEGLNNISVSEGELSVTGVRKNAAVKKIWDKIDELTTAIIVSNGETE